MLPLVNMCLATFASEYRVLPKSQIPKDGNSNVIQLKNNFGFITKITNEEKPAVIRYARLSPMKQSEAYHHSILQLFLPHYLDCQLKPAQFETYKDFYDHGAVNSENNTLENVKSIVGRNQALFEKEVDKIAEAEKTFKENGELGTTDLPSS